QYAILLRSSRDRHGSRHRQLIHCGKSHGRSSSSLQISDGSRAIQEENHGCHAQSRSRGTNGVDSALESICEIDKQTNLRRKFISHIT
ncbi:hypothetical protein PFISCL1PPCAC_16043, partial [Pristionchus fissidentatus]